MPSPLRFHEDPGHGWLEVTAADISALGLSPGSFSDFSYTDGAGTYFLEEDCDAGHFIEARRRARWARLSVALWAAAGASFAACIVIGARHPESPAIGYAAAAMFLCAIAADCAAERGAR